jgi:hypothetical protein
VDATEVSVSAGPHLNEARRGVSMSYFWGWSLVQCISAECADQHVLQGRRTDLAAHVFTEHGNKIFRLFYNIVVD